MPTGYRIELSPNARAVCKNLECKKAGTKIEKGELRFGSLFTIDGHTSWAYKHWGCVTPEQIKNVQGFIEGDMDLLDGYDEIPPEAQAKIDFAMENGHVPDEDWRGDVELNRPGKKGFRVKVSKKRAAKDDAGDSDDDNPKPKKKRGRPAKKDDNETEDAAPKKPARATKDDDQKKTRGNKTAIKDEAEDDGLATAPKKARGKKAKAAAVKEEGSDGEAEPETKKSRVKKSSAKAETVEDKAPKPAKANPQKVSTKASYAEEPTDEESESEVEAPKAKRGKKAVSADKNKRPAPQKRGKKSQATADDE